MVSSSEILMCGNPNVGKSTLFNRLTGLHQHTGNWPGKTVGVASGKLEHNGTAYTLYDLPGIYSLCSRSAEEELARDAILFGQADCCVVVCDATCLSRGLTLALQIMEVTPRIVICVNLMDEAREKGVHIDLPMLEKKLGVPVAGVCAASGEGMDDLLNRIAHRKYSNPRPLEWNAEIREALQPLADYLSGQPLPALWLARTLIEGEMGLCQSLGSYLCLDPQRDVELCKLIDGARNGLGNCGMDPRRLGEMSACAIRKRAEEIAESCAVRQETAATARDRKLDKYFLHPIFGIPVMLIMLAGILWLTIWGANWPSEVLGKGLFALGEYARQGMESVGIPACVISALVDGVWRTTAWVVSVMLPPMAIFFPLFSFLEDLGYLPRVAFQLDGAFSRCSACGKQGLTMCMGLGCNAAGVTGCRIIDSPRERLIAILTNAFVPCNGRFPMLIALSVIFFAKAGRGGTITAVLILVGLLGLGVFCTFAASSLLGSTVLQGCTSSFALELPPYRKPKLGRILVRSLLDRTAFVLGRSLLVAAPAGLVLWLLANIGDGVILQWLRDFFEPLGNLLGMDGAILLAFLLALPANEIVLPIALMTYSAGTVMVATPSLEELGALLSANGWSGLTALCVMVFSVLHWPCGTTLLTIRRETESWGWTAMAAILPTAFGCVLCVLLRHLGT